jgi:hypothetical protein
MSVSRRGAVIATGLLAAANSTFAADSPPTALESTPSTFVIEIAGLGSADPLDQRLSELVFAPLDGSGQWVVVAADRGELREAEADLVLLASEDPVRAMGVLRGRTSDFRIELGVQGSVSELEEVYGIATFAAEFEVSLTLVRSIDGRIAASSIGRGRARREDRSLASEAALAEATTLAVDPVLLALDEAFRRSRCGVEVVLTASSVGETEAARIRSHLPVDHRVVVGDGMVRIEPAPSAEVLAAVASASGWVVLDRGAGVAVLGVADVEPSWVRTVALIAAGLSVAVASLRLIARSRRGGSS